MFNVATKGSETGRPRASRKRMAECKESTATSTALCGVLRLEVLFLSSGSTPPFLFPKIDRDDTRDDYQC